MAFIQKKRKEVDKPLIKATKNVRKRNKNFEFIMVTQTTINKTVFFQIHLFTDEVI